MREIKFRGRRIDNGKWVEGDLYNHPDNRYPLICCIRSEYDDGRPVNVLREFEVDPETVGQFTGLKDKNGVEIWENDIDKTGLMVKWNQLHCCWGLFSSCGYQDELMADFCDSKGNAPKEWKTSDVEVIGNIFENNELLQP